MGTISEKYNYIDYSEESALERLFYSDNRLSEDKDYINAWESDPLSDKFECDECDEIFDSDVYEKEQENSSCCNNPPISERTRTLKEKSAKRAKMIYERLKDGTFPIWATEEDMKDWNARPSMCRTLDAEMESDNSPKQNSETEKFSEEIFDENNMIETSSHNSVLSPDEFHELAKLTREADEQIIAKQTQAENRKQQDKPKPVFDDGLKETSYSFDETPPAPVCLTEDEERERRHKLMGGYAVTSGSYTFYPTQILEPLPSYTPAKPVSGLESDDALNVIDEEYNTYLNKMREVMYKGLTYNHPDYPKSKFPQYYKNEWFLDHIWYETEIAKLPFYMLDKDRRAVYDRMVELSDRRKDVWDHHPDNPDRIEWEVFNKTRWNRLMDVGSKFEINDPTNFDTPSDDYYTKLQVCEYSTSNQPIAKKPKKDEKFTFFHNLSFEAHNYGRGDFTPAEIIQSLANRLRDGYAVAHRFNNPINKPLHVREKTQANFVMASFVFLDFDNVPREIGNNLGNIVSKLLKTDVEPHIAYETYSSTVDHLKFRFVYLLSDPIRHKGAYKRLCQDLNHKIMQHIPGLVRDPMCDKVDQFYYGAKFGTIIYSCGNKKYIKLISTKNYLDPDPEYDESIRSVDVMGDINDPRYISEYQEQHERTSTHPMYITGLLGHFFTQLSSGTASLSLSEKPTPYPIQKQLEIILKAMKNYRAEYKHILPMYDNLSFINSVDDFKLNRDKPFYDRTSPYMEIKTKFAYNMGSYNIAKLKDGQRRRKSLVEWTITRRCFFRLLDLPEDYWLLLYNFMNDALNKIDLINGESIDAYSLSNLFSEAMRYEITSADLQDRLRKNRVYAFAQKDFIVSQSYCEKYDIKNKRRLANQGRSINLMTNRLPLVYEHLNAESDPENPTYEKFDDSNILFYLTCDYLSKMVSKYDTDIKDQIEWGITLPQNVSLETPKLRTPKMLIDYIWGKPDLFSDKNNYKERVDKPLYTVRKRGRPRVLDMLLESLGEISESIPSFYGNPSENIENEKTIAIKHLRVSLGGNRSPLYKEYTKLKNIFQFQTKIHGMDVRGWESSCFRETKEDLERVYQKFFYNDKNSLHTKVFTHTPHTDERKSSIQEALRIINIMGGIYSIPTTKRLEMTEENVIGMYMFKREENGIKFTTDNPSETVIKGLYKAHKEACDLPIDAQKEIEIAKEAVFAYCTEPDPEMGDDKKLVIRANPMIDTVRVSQALYMLSTLVPDSEAFYSFLRDVDKAYNQRVAKCWDETLIKNIIKRLDEYNVFFRPYLQVETDIQRATSRERSVSQLLVNTTKTVQGNSYTIFDMLIALNRYVYTATQRVIHRPNEANNSDIYLHIIALYRRMDEKDRKATRSSYKRTREKTESLIAQIDEIRSEIAEFEKLDIKGVHKSFNHHETEKESLLAIGNTDKALERVKDMLEDIHKTTKPITTEQADLYMIIHRTLNRLRQEVVAPILNNYKGIHSILTDCAYKLITELEMKNLGGAKNTTLDFLQTPNYPLNTYITISSDPDKVPAMETWVSSLDEIITSDSKKRDKTKELYIPNKDRENGRASSFFDKMIRGTVLDMISKYAQIIYETAEKNPLATTDLILRKIEEMEQREDFVSPNIKDTVSRHMEDENIQYISKDRTYNTIKKFAERNRVSIQSRLHTVLKEFFIQSGFVTNLIAERNKTRDLNLLRTQSLCSSMVEYVEKRTFNSAKKLHTVSETFVDALNNIQEDLDTNKSAFLGMISSVHEKERSIIISAPQGADTFVDEPDTFQCFKLAPISRLKGIKFDYDSVSIISSAYEAALYDLSLKSLSSDQMKTLSLALSHVSEERFRLFNDKELPNFYAGSTQTNLYFEEQSKGSLEPNDSSLSLKTLNSSLSSSTSLFMSSVEERVVGKSSKSNIGFSPFSIMTKNRRLKFPHKVMYILTSLYNFIPLYMECWMSEEKRE